MYSENQTILEIIKQTTHSWKETGNHPGEMIYKFNFLLRLLEYFKLDKNEVDTWIQTLSSDRNIPLVFSIPSNESSRELLMLYRPNNWEADATFEWELCVEEYYAERYGQHIDWID